MMPVILEINIKMYPNEKSMKSYKNIIQVCTFGIMYDRKIEIL